MKITVKIREVAESRGIKNAYQLKIKVGLSPSNAAKLFDNNIKLISLETLEKLCAALECEPKDLLKISKTKISKKGITNKN